MDATSVIIAASGWVAIALWGLWFWHHKRKVSREPEKLAAELRLMDAQTGKLRLEKEHLDAQLEELREKQGEDREGHVGIEVARRERDSAIVTLSAYRELHEQGLGLCGLLQAYYAGRYAWVVHGMHPSMLETASPDVVLNVARETFENGMRLAEDYGKEPDHLADLRILAKRLRWENAG